MDKKKKVDVNLKCAFGFAVAAFLFNLVAFVSPYWIVARPEFPSQFVRLGLWVACFDNYIHPEDYVSKMYSGCWYVYWPEYDYIRDWLNPPWFYAVQMLSSLSLLCNGLGFIIIMLKFVDALSLIDKKTNLLSLLLQFVAFCCYIVVVVAMGVMSKDREWMPRPDHNQVSWSFAFAVLGGFFTIFCFFHLIIHYLVYTWAPNAKPKDKQDYSELPLREDVNSTIYKSQQGSGIGMNPTGGSNLYSQVGNKPISMAGTTSGATASAKVREAMSQKIKQTSNEKNQYGGSISSLNSAGVLKNKVGSTHSLASMGRGPQVETNTRGSLSSLHQTNRQPSRRNYDDDSSVV